MPTFNERLSSIEREINSLLQEVLQAPSMETLSSLIEEYDLFLRTSLDKINSLKAKIKRIEQEVEKRISEPKF